MEGELFALIVATKSCLGEGIITLRLADTQLSGVSAEQLGEVGFQN